MTLTQLEHVLEAHRAGSFSQAARTCGVSQAALSNSIAKLEEELGERIFSRTTRQVSLSPFGLTLISHVEQILIGRDALLAAAKAQRAPTTTVVGHSPLIPPRLVTQVVGAIRDAHLGGQIRLIEENLEDLLQRLSEHTIDVAFLPEADYPSSIRSAPVGHEPLYYVPRRSLEAKGDNVHVEAIAADTFVMSPTGAGSLARHGRSSRRLEFPFACTTVKRWAITSCKSGLRSI
jgi:DNA-binding transcriptional LysR family regulator